MKPPTTRPSISASDFIPVIEYIAQYWPRIIRQNYQDHGTLIGLPCRYLVPSDGSMFQEQYYWDSFFMGLGVVGTEHEQLIVDMAVNMAHLVRRFHLIPNSSRFYMLSRSQPPMFTSLIWLAHDVKQRRGDPDTREFLQEMIAVAIQEHEQVWMGTAQPHHRQVFAGLSRYFDINYLHILASCESGWDHSTRCDDRWLDHLPIDLNAILYARERDFARAADYLGQPAEAYEWCRRAAQRAEVINELMYDAEKGFFFDFDYTRQQRNPDPSLAGFFPLWAGLATPEQAERMVQLWLPAFERPGGLLTTLRRRRERQWAAPNGWAPLHWIVVNGLERYGYTAEAQRIMWKWCANCAAVFAKTNKMWEKYNVLKIGCDVEHGLYGSVEGFGWSNAIFKDFAERLGIAAAYNNGHSAYAMQQVASRSQA